MCQAFQILFSRIVASLQRPPDESIENSKFILYNSNVYIPPYPPRIPSFVKNKYIISQFPTISLNNLEKKKYVEQYLYAVIEIPTSL